MWFIIRWCLYHNLQENFGKFYRCKKLDTTQLHNLYIITFCKTACGFIWKLNVIRSKQRWPVQDPVNAEKTCFVLYGLKTDLSLVLMGPPVFSHLSSFSKCQTQDSLLWSPVCSAVTEVFFLNGVYFFLFLKKSLLYIFCKPGKKLLYFSPVFCHI